MITNADVQVACCVLSLETACERVGGKLPPLKDMTALDLLRYIGPNHIRFCTDDNGQDYATTARIVNIITEGLV